MVALVSPDGVAPSRMVGVSASVNLPLHHKVQKFSSGTGSSRWSRKKGRKTVVVVWLPKNQVKCPIFLRQCITDVNVFIVINIVLLQTLAFRTLDRTYTNEPNSFSNCIIFALYILSIPLICILLNIMRFRPLPE